MTFAERVWWLVARIPPGQVMTYGDMALALGAPRAARMVGGALHYAPNTDDLPWQRVVNRAGGVSPRACEHSVDEQAALLRDDGVEVGERDGAYFIDLARYRWWPEPPLLAELEAQASAPPLPDPLLDQLAFAPDRPRRWRR